MPVVDDYRSLIANYDYSNTSWNAAEALQFPVFISYSFYEANNLPTASQMPYQSTTTQVFTPAQRDAFRAALEVFETVTGVRFVETKGNAMIRAHGVTGSSYGGWADFPYSSASYTSSSDLVLDTTSGPLLTGFGFQIILHEIGHTLGLSHPHEGHFTLNPALNSTTTTLMSYNWAATPNVLLGAMDVDALAYLYGDSLDVTGWSYGFSGRVFEVQAADGDDRILGVNARNMIDGGAGNDVIVGRKFADIFRGGAGDDHLKGMGGEDVLRGGTGNDRLWASSQDVGDHAKNELFGGAGDDVLKGSAGADTLRGDAGNDVLRATTSGVADSTRNELYGGDGHDRLFGAGGHDWLMGGRGDDVIRGGGGNDVVGGKAGDDILHGNTGNDTVSGDNGKDRLYGGDGDDKIFGGGGDDTIHAGTGDDHVQGGRGSDTVYLGKGHDVFQGDAQRGANNTDIIHGGRGHDRISGGGASDTIFGDQGNDILTGNAGADVFRFDSNATGRDTISDFTIGEDLLWFDGYTMDDLIFRDLGADTKIKWDNGSVTLTGVDADALGAGDFVFV